jgi:hypothetical protein
MKLIFPPAFKMNKEILYQDTDYCFALSGGICEIGSLNNLEESPSYDINLWVYMYNSTHTLSHISKTVYSLLSSKNVKNG